MSTATPAATQTGGPVERGAALGQWNSAVASFYLLLGSTLLLTGLGLVMVLSSSSITSLTSSGNAYATFFNQTRYAMVGLVLFWLASRMPLRFYKQYAWIFVGVAVVAQLLVFSPLGESHQGNTNWIRIGQQSIQPSEAAKLAIAVWLASVLATKRPLLGDWKHVFIPAVPVTGAVMGLVLLGRDLGTAMILMVILAGALFVAGVPLRMFAVAGAVMGVVVGAMVYFSSNRMNRIFSFLDPECDTQDACFQPQHGLYGLGSGGLTGQGLGASREKWILPLPHNDFIFAIIGEELGLLGTLLVLALFGVLAVAMNRVIRRHPDPFVKIATGAICCWILGQALINIGVVIGVFPVIGIPLPLVSAGGSALITTLLALGVVLSFARHEPGAAEAMAARPSVVRRSLAVLGRA